MTKHRLVTSSLLLGMTLILLPMLTPLRGRVIEASAQQVAPSRGQMSEQVTLRAAERGNPWINLQDGRELPTSFAETALAQLLESPSAQPRALAAGDFDEDGTPDLLSGYASTGRGMLVFHRGNVDALYPNSPAAEQRKQQGTFTDAPFLAAAQVFELPLAPDFLATGDFDADGHLDVVAATTGDQRLCWLRGTGDGNFRPAVTKPLIGSVTALTAGEINRADGLIDLAVGIMGTGGPQLLIYEAPAGALQAEPEIIPLPAGATALALGQLDESYEMDLAVAAGTTLLLVHGRDRKLSLDAIEQAAVPPVSSDLLFFPFALTSLALGDFIWDREHRLEMALLSEDGTVHLLQRGELATRQYTESEIKAERAAANQDKRREAETWELTFSQSLHLALPRSGSALSHLLVTARISSLPTDDLVVLDPTNYQLDIIGNRLYSEHAEL